MYCICKHIASVFVLAAYLCGNIAPVIENASYQAHTISTHSFKVEYTEARPITIPCPVKAPQRFVKEINGSPLSPVLTEIPYNRQEFSSEYQIRSSESECACLFFAYTSLSNRAPPAA